MEDYKNLNNEELWQRLALISDEIICQQRMALEYEDRIPVVPEQVLREALTEDPTKRWSLMEDLMAIRRDKPLRDHEAECEAECERMLLDFFRRGPK